jgi:hypothetical protein
MKILSTSRSGSVSKKRKASASRSPTAKKSGKKSSSKLHIDDLNLSSEDIRARRSSTSKKRQPSDSQDTSINQGSSIQDSKVATPRRSIPVSANKKDSRLRSVERNLDRSGERDRSKERDGGLRESEIYTKSGRKSSIGELDGRNMNRLSSHALLAPVEPVNKYNLGSGFYIVEY